MTWIGAAGQIAEIQLQQKNHNENKLSVAIDKIGLAGWNASI